MTKKEFIAQIDAIIWAETPEQQKKLINELYKNASAKNCNLQNVSNSLRNVVVQSHQFYTTGKFHRYIDINGETFALVELDSGYLYDYSLNNHRLKFCNDY